MQESLNSILSIFEETKQKLTTFVSNQQEENANLQSALTQGERELAKANKALKQVNKLVGTK